MILLDTNVILEPWKHEPDGAVVAWLDAQAIETLFISAISVAELRFWIASMPSCKRQTILRDRLEEEVLPHFAERILPVGIHTSQCYAQLMARGESDSQGRRIYCGHSDRERLGGRNPRYKFV